MGKEDKKYYSLFNPKTKDFYELMQEKKDQQLLAFYLAYKNGVKGYLINLFKKKFLKQAIEREDELYRKFLKPQLSVTMPRELKKKVLSIYREEL